MIIGIKVFSNYVPEESVIRKKQTQCKVTRFKLYLRKNATEKIYQFILLFFLYTVFFECFLW